MIVYSVGIIDFWNGWQQPRVCFGRGLGEDGKRPWSEWEQLWIKAKRISEYFGRQDWSDLAFGPVISVVPNMPDEFWECSILIGWKFRNNGATYIASERFRIPWLASCVWYAECK